jgi:hypothetical protein
MSRNMGFSRRVARNPIVPRAAIGATHGQVMAKVEWHHDELSPRAGFVVTSIRQLPADRIRPFHERIAF